MRAIIKEKRERSLGTKLFLKADRSYSEKSATVRKPYKAGQHGQARSRGPTDFGRQLQEKQKIQFSFGLTNKQMEALFSGSRQAAVEKLYRRLDYITFLLGFAKSVRVARQLVSHGHITVNGRKVTVASALVGPKDLVSIRPESRDSKLFAELGERLKQHKTPTWLELDREQLTGKFVRPVDTEETQFPFDVALVGEYYSR